MLHGPSTNRWFDKHQLIITHNGKAGMLFEVIGIIKKNYLDYIIACSG